MRLMLRPLVKPVLLTILGILVAAVLFVGPSLRGPLLWYEKLGPGTRNTLEITEDGQATAGDYVWHLSPQRMAALNSQIAAHLFAQSDHYSNMGREAPLYTIETRQGIFSKKVIFSDEDDTPPELIAFQQYLETLREEVERNGIRPTLTARP